MTSRLGAPLPARPLPVPLVGTRVVEIAAAPDPRESPVASFSAAAPAHHLRAARRALGRERAATLDASAAGGHASSVAPASNLAAFPAAKWITSRPRSDARSRGHVDHSATAKWISGTRPLKRSDRGLRLLPGPSSFCHAVAAEPTRDPSLGTSSRPIPADLRGRLQTRIGKALQASGLPPCIGAGVYLHAVLHYMFACGLPRGRGRIAAGKALRAHGIVLAPVGTHPTRIGALVVGRWARPVEPRRRGLAEHPERCTRTGIARRCCGTGCCIARRRRVPANIQKRRLTRHRRVGR